MQNCLAQIEWLWQYTLQLSAENEALKRELRRSRKSNFCILIISHSVIMSKTFCFDVVALGIYAWLWAG